MKWVFSLAIVFVFGCNTMKTYNNSTIKTLHVSVDGNDKNSGTKNKPLASIEAAKDKVRELRSKGQQGDIKVFIHGGTYYLDKTLVFSTEDNAPEGSYTYYCAAPGEKPVLSGGVVLDGWKKLEKAPVFLPKSAHGNVWVCDLNWATPENRFHALMLDGQFLKRSSSENSSVKNIEKIKRAYGKFLGPMKYRKNFAFTDGFRQWPNMGDIELFTQPTRHWLVNYLPLKEIDLEKKTGKFNVQATYSIGKGGAIENSIDYLDTPGEWCLNTLEKRVYYWPKSGTPEKGLTATYLDELIRVEGVSDASLEGTKEKPVRGIVFEGLTLSNCDRQRWEPEDKGLQHDWNMWDKNNGLIRFRSAEDCRISNCNFINTASDGVRLDRYCQNITVEKSLFKNIGGTGVLLAGYGPGLKDVNKNNKVSHNTITQTGQLFYHSPAVFVWQSGHNTISNNHVYDLGYTGMVFAGVRRRFFPRLFKEENPFKQWNVPDDARENMPTIRWEEIELKEGITNWDSYKPFMHTRNNLIAYNEIHDCMKILDDGNAIYLSADGSANKIEHNVLYNHPKGYPIRTDDDSHGNSANGNVVFATSSAGGIRIKGLNTAENNILINGEVSTGFAGNACDPNSVFQKNIFYHTVSTDKLGFHYKLNMVEGSNLDNNVFYHTNVEALKAKRQLHEKFNRPEHDENSVYENPLFTNIESGDLSLSKHSPALKLGIESQPSDFMKKVGPANDPFMNRYEKIKDHLLYPENLMVTSVKLELKL